MENGATTDFSLSSGDEDLSTAGDDEFTPVQEERQTKARNDIFQ
ncbi:MAG: hypothetical protein WCC87_02045 [Candidatus Korobacteraceae bacterium]